MLLLIYLKTKKLTILFLSALSEQKIWKIGTPVSEPHENPMGGQLLSQACAWLLGEVQSRFSRRGNSAPSNAGDLFGPLGNADQMHLPQSDLLAHRHSGSSSDDQQCRASQSCK